MSYDSLLYRPLKDGKQYNALLPATTCERTKLGKGDTGYSIEQMVAMVLQYNWQTDKLAPVLQKSSLPLTVSSIHDFLYNHFQYKADGSDQMLRSPACSWYDRKNGIDCKSYSIFASCLLMSMGINHHIRKIKQPASESPNDYSHVYVIVPIDQKNSDLTKGYYVIDGTLKDNNEPAYSEAKDFYMTNDLAQNGLNGATGLNGFNVGTITGYFNTPISCWGGSAFSGKQAESTAKAIVLYFDDLIAKINQAVKNGDVAALSDLDNKFYAWSNGAKHAYMAKLTRGWNKCTTESSNRMISILAFYETVVYKGFDAWVKQYFDVVDTGQIIRRYGDVYEPAPANFYFSYEPNDWRESKVRRFTPKPVTSSIMAFEFTPYMEKVAAGTEALNLPKLLSSLTTVLVAVQTVANGGTPVLTTPPINPNTGQPYQDDFNDGNDTKTAGGGALGWILVLGALGFGLSQLKTDEKQKK